MHKVLMVEDDGQIIQLTHLRASLLENIEFTAIRIMEDGSAVDLDSREEVDLSKVWVGQYFILLDYMMPGTTGDKVLDLWQSSGMSAQAVQVIGTSSLPDPWDYQLADYINKIDIGKWLENLNET